MMMVRILTVLVVTVWLTQSLSPGLLAAGAHGQTPAPAEARPRAAGGPYC